MSSPSDRDGVPRRTRCGREAAKHRAIRLGIGSDAGPKLAGPLHLAEGKQARLSLAGSTAGGPTEEPAIPVQRGLAVAGARWGGLCISYPHVYDHAGWGLGCTGHDEGVQNYNVTFVDRGIGVVLMSNNDNFEGVSRQLLEATIGDTCSPVEWMGYPRFDPNEQRDPPPPDPQPIKVERALLQSYVGTYQVGDGREFRIELRETGLVQSMDGIDWTPLLAETADRFFVESEDQRLVFVVDESGRVLRLDFLADGQVSPLDRVER